MKLKLKLTLKLSAIMTGNSNNEANFLHNNIIN